MQNRRARQAAPAQRTCALDARLLNIIDLLSSGAFLDLTCNFFEALITDWCVV